MKLREYLKKYCIGVEEFARRAGLSDCILWHHFSGRRNPSQRTAEKIEKESDGLVTVMELRGKDARKK